MLESTVEGKLTKALEAHGCVVRKFVSPGRRGVTDRIVIWPCGTVDFVELKKEKGKLRVNQKLEQARLVANNANVYAVAGLTAAIKYIEMRRGELQ